MGFFTRIPRAVRHLGQQWFVGMAIVPPLKNAAVPDKTAGAVSADTEIFVPSPPAIAHKDLPKLRTICAKSVVLEQHSKAVRMVISGRLADVCAELDRLIALETQPTLH